jgi:hypothetical protein
MKAPIYLVFGLFCAVCVSTAQTTDTNTAVGFPPFGAFAGSDFDTINEGNLNVHFSIPIFEKSGRGLSLAGRLTYDSLIWTANPAPTDGSGNPIGTAYFWLDRANSMGWYYRPVVGYVSYTTRQAGPTCSDHRMLTVRENFTYHEPSGTAHFIGMNVLPADCDGNGNGGSATAQDGSGFLLSVDSSMKAIVVGVDGTLIEPPQSESGSGISG